MKNRIFNLFLLTLLIQSPTMGQVLESHLWQDRVILLFASDMQDSNLQTQLQFFEKKLDGLKERKLTVYQITPTTLKKNSSDFFEKNFKENLYQKYKPNKDEFTFILIGLDGGEKMRSTKVVSLAELFGEIDSMPMRQWEMKN